MCPTCLYIHLGSVPNPSLHLDFQYQNKPNLHLRMLKHLKTTSDLDSGQDRITKSIFQFCRIRLTYPEDPILRFNRIRITLIEIKRFEILDPGKWVFWHWYCNPCFRGYSGPSPAVFTGSQLSPVLLPSNGSEVIAENSDPELKLSSQRTSAGKPFL